MDGKKSIRERGWCDFGKYRLVGKWYAYKVCRQEAKEFRRAGKDGGKR